MAEQQQVADIDDQEPDETPGYKPPAQVSMSEILDKDAEDESLRKYKASLGVTADHAVFFENDPRKVIVDKMALKPEGRPEMIMDLRGDLKEMKKKTYVIKEGCRYQIVFYFYVQREIVSGLRYLYKISRGPFKESGKEMLGSYAPKKEMYEVKTPMEDAPKGITARGKYAVHSRFTDDDKTEYVNLEWQLEIKKDW